MNKFIAPFGVMVVVALVFYIVASQAEEPEPVQPTFSVGIVDTPAAGECAVWSETPWGVAWTACSSSANTIEVYQASTVVDATAPGLNITTDYLRWIPGNTPTLDVVTTMAWPVATLANTATALASTTGCAPTTFASALSDTGVLGCQNVALGTDTTGNFVLSITGATGLTDDCAAAESVACTIGWDFATTPTDGQAVAWDATLNQPYGTDFPSGSGYDTIEDEGTPLTQRSVLNFEGAGVECADDTTKTTCTIAGGAAQDAFYSASGTSGDTVTADSATFHVFFTSDDGTMIIVSSSTADSLDFSIDISASSLAQDAIWRGGTGNLAEAVTLPGCAANERLSYSTSTHLFSCAALNLDDLGDVTWSNPQNGQVALWNGSALVNATISGDLSCDGSGVCTVSNAATADAFTNTPAACGGTLIWLKQITTAGNPASCTAWDVTQATLTDDSVWVGGAGNFGAAEALCDDSGGALLWDTATNSFSCGGFLDAGDYLTADGTTINLDPEVVIRSYVGSLASPTVDDDGRLFMQFGAAFTLAAFNCQTTSGTVTVTIDVRSLFATSAGSTVVSAQPCTTSGNRYTSFGVSAATPDQRYYISIDAVSDGDALFMVPAATGTVDE